MCFLVDLFFLIELFFSYWLLHEAALDPVLFQKKASIFTYLFMLEFKLSITVKMWLFLNFWSSSNFFNVLTIWLVLAFWLSSMDWRNDIMWIIWLGPDDPLITWSFLSVKRFLLICDFPGRGGDAGLPDCRGR